MNAATAPATETAPKARCFVVMGFGVKTDLATGRKLDLDKSYRLLIKPSVEAANLECIRADEIRHSGTIDVPMYRELLGADFAIADLSTANPNAIYEHSQLLEAEKEKDRRAVRNYPKQVEDRPTCRVTPCLSEPLWRYCPVNEMDVFRSPTLFDSAHGNVGRRCGMRRDLRDASLGTVALASIP
jgi:hypothetical protein